MLRRELPISGGLMTFDCQQPKTSNQSLQAKASRTRVSLTDS